MLLPLIPSNPPLHSTRALFQED